MYLLDTSVVLELLLDQDRAGDLKELTGIAQQFGLDFDDAYQYAIAERYGLIIVSFDSDFDRTERGRKTPAELIGT